MKQAQAKQTFQVQWLSHEFILTSQLHTRPNPKDVFKAVRAAMADECKILSGKEAEDMQSMLHLTRSLAKFDPYLIGPEDETLADTPIKGMNGGCTLRSSVLHLNLKICLSQDDGSSSQDSDLISLTTRASKSKNASVSINLRLLLYLHFVPLHSSHTPQLVQAWFTLPKSHTYRFQLFPFCCFSDNFLSFIEINLGSR